MAENIENAFATITDNAEKIHNYYIRSKRKCTDICHLKPDKGKMTKDKKFQHKWLFHATMAKCSGTDIWCLTYIDGLGMFCAVCRMSNVSQPKNDSNVWNSEPKVRYRTETVRGHLVCTSDHKTTHGHGVESEELKRKSYFVEKEREKWYKVYEKIFHAAHWLAKEEIGVIKFKSILTLLESVGVEDIEIYETCSSHIVREMVIMLSDLLKEKLISNTEKAGMYALIIDEVTDISNMQQLLTFVKYHIIDTREPKTKFLHTADLLSESEEANADAKSIFESLKNLIQNQLQLDLAHLKAFVSDGASVMTGREKGVAARFRKVEESSTMLNVHCVCYRLALACSDTVDKLKFIEDFELTMIQLWKLLKNSPKRLKIYIKKATACKNYINLSKYEKKRVVRTIKKVVRTRWLSLDIGVDALFKEYVGMTQALKIMKQDRVVVGT